MRRPGLLHSWLVLPILGARALETAVPAAPLCASMPTFIWGGHAAYLDAVNSYEPESLGHAEFSDIMQGFRDHPIQPEVAVVMVLPASFQSEGAGKAALPSLHKAMTSSPSSRVIPCVTRSSYESVEGVFTSPEGDIETLRVEPHELVPTVNSRLSFSDGKLDVVVTAFPSDVSAFDVNEMLEQVQNALEKSVAGGRYLVFQTSEFDAKHPLGLNRRKLTAPRRLAEATEPYYQTTYVYVTPNVLAGLLTIVLFFFITYIGVTCLAALQTPSKFINSRIPEGKEF